MVGCGALAPSNALSWRRRQRLIMTRTFLRKTNTHGHSCSHNLGVFVGGDKRKRQGARGKGHATRRAGQVFRLHFEMFPARTLRSVSPSALRVYIWQRMQGRGCPPSPGYIYISSANPYPLHPFHPPWHMYFLLLSWLATRCLFVALLLRFVCRGSSAK